MALHNPNNWHWVNKDVSAWTKNYLQETLSRISVESDGVSAKIEKVLSMDGDVDVSQRKGKVITLYDVKLQLEYEGKTKDDETVTGTINIPEVAHDTEEDEFVFDIEAYSDSASKQPVKDIVRSKLVPQLRVALSKLSKTLIEEHGKDIQHAPGSNPSSGFATPTMHTQKSTTPPVTSKTSTATTGKLSVNTTTVTASDEFRTTAEEMYTTFTDPQRIAAFTRGPPRQFDGAKVGGKFSIFDGNVTGEFSLVQKWRLAQWPEGHYSTQEIFFDQNDVDRVTVMRVTWTGVPIGQEEVVQRNWEGYYVRSIKQTFGYSPPPSFGNPVPRNPHPSLPSPSHHQSYFWTFVLMFVFVFFLAVGLARYSEILPNLL
ncbi:Aha1 domain family [Talaromyces proteolyticus]|uniref:Aha1 domain family n=1 Tax=Talaromyces proteolyticus TaxID=1131652 RepID=A0AAD4KRG6_9EURO|nr:Aha1 domain family [Talaromyces proteolyticus]KAH8697624.1 Aha1 domain family [Talaromyces proteolyticus]